MLKIRVIFSVVAILILCKRELSSSFYLFPIFSSFLLANYWLWLILNNFFEQLSFKQILMEMVLYYQNAVANSYWVIRIHARKHRAIILPCPIESVQTT